MYTSSTWSGLIPALSMAPFIASAPSSGAFSEAKAPRKLHTGVLAKDTMTTSYDIKSRNVVRPYLTDESSNMNA